MMNLSVVKAVQKKFMIKHRLISLIQRLIRPEEIANIALFLCPALASAFNGEGLVGNVI